MSHTTEQPACSSSTAARTHRVEVLLVVAPRPIARSAQTGSARIAVLPMVERSAKVCLVALGAIGHTGQDLP
jgi:hypothetical protein